MLSVHQLDQECAQVVLIETHSQCPVRHATLAYVEVVEGEAAVSLVGVIMGSPGSHPCHTPATPPLPPPKPPGGPPPPPLFT